MTSGARAAPGGERTPSVLVVDDDRRVLELIEIAYTTHGFRVLTAADGQEAMQKVLTERPDLLVLDVRLPRKSGLEVCELLRRDPQDAQLPIIMVSAAGETDARLKGFSAGADDYLPKPFSPRELIARSRRLLARAGEGRELRGRVSALEHDLARAQDEVKRSLLETRREQRLRQLAAALDDAFHRTLDLDELVRRILHEARARFGVGVVGLLLRDEGAGAFVPEAVRGDGLDRLARLEFALDSPLARLLPALGRPAMVRELHRLPELADDIPPLVAARIARVAPLCSSAGLEAMLVTDERLDGFEPPRAELEMLSVLCAAAGVALHAARRLRAQNELDLELAWPAEEPESGMRAEAAAVVEHAARATLLEPRLCALVVHGVRLGDGARHGASRGRLERLAARDPSGRIGELLRLIEAAAGAPDAAALPEWSRAATLLLCGDELARARLEGLDRDAALIRARARAAAALDPATAQALEAAMRELASADSRMPVTSSSAR
jgi:DNA-binding response OmpR family regulator